MVSILSMISTVPILLQILKGLFQARNRYYQVSYSKAFLILWQSPNICLSFWFLLFSLSDQLEQQDPLHGYLFIYLIIFVK